MADFSIAKRLRNFENEGHWNLLLKSLIIHAEKAKEITTVKEVWICDLNYHKIWWTFAVIFSKNY